MVGVTAYEGTTQGVGRHLTSRRPASLLSERWSTGAAGSERGSERDRQERSVNAGSPSGVADPACSTPSGPYGTNGGMHCPALHSTLRS